MGKNTNSRQEQIKEINHEIDLLRFRRDEIREELVVECIFMQGEKVHLTEILSNGKEISGHDMFGYVNKITVDSHGNYKYHIRKEKKNGEPSSLFYSKFDNFKIRKLIN